MVCDIEVVMVYGMVYIERWCYGMKCDSLMFCLRFSMYVRLFPFRYICSMYLFVYVSMDMYLFMFQWSYVQLFMFGWLESRDMMGESGG